MAPVLAELPPTPSCSSPLPPHLGALVQLRASAAQRAPHPAARVAVLERQALLGGGGGGDGGCSGVCRPQAPCLPSTRQHPPAPHAPPPPPPAAASRSHSAAPWPRACQHPPWRGQTQPPHAGAAHPPRPPRRRPPPPAAAPPSSACDGTCGAARGRAEWPAAAGWPTGGPAGGARAAGRPPVLAICRLLPRSLRHGRPTHPLSGSREPGTPLPHLQPSSPQSPTPPHPLPSTLYPPSTAAPAPPLTPCF